MMALSNGAGLSGTVPCNYKGTTKRAENQIFRHLKNEGFKTLSPPSSVGAYLLNSPFFTKYSPICTALRAAPLRIWSPVSQRVMPLSLARSRRTRPT